MAANLSPSHTEPQFGTTFQQRLQFEQPGHFSRHLPDQQSNNLIMINQFSIIDIHHHHCPQNYDSVLNQFKNISSAADDSTIGTFSDKQMANSYSCADSQPEIAAPLPSPMSSYNSSLSSNLSSNKMNDSTIRIDNACKLLAISAGKWSSIRITILFQWHFSHLIYQYYYYFSDANFNLTTFRLIAIN